MKIMILNQVFPDLSCLRTDGSWALCFITPFPSLPFPKEYKNGQKSEKWPKYRYLMAKFF